MHTLTITPSIPFRIPAQPLAITLVGCGGTGSHLAQTLARLARHVRESGGLLDLTFMDGDTVEPKNVGRQLFAPSEVGRNKAQVLATRFSAVFGLPISAVPQMADRVQQFDHHRDALSYRIAVGAVDGVAGRSVLELALALSHIDLWLDCGNHEHDGQVVLGTAPHAQDLAGAFAIDGMCAGLPAPSLQLPALLTARPPAPRRDCAQAVADNAQAFQINTVIAQVAGQYLAQLALARQVSHFATWISLTGMVMRSTPITAANVAEATCIPLADLITQKRRAA